MLGFVSQSTTIPQAYAQLLWVSLVASKVQIFKTREPV
jgi:hypothetical protein